MKTSQQTNNKIIKKVERKNSMTFFSYFFDDIFENPKIFENHDFSSKKSLFPMRKPMKKVTFWREKS